MAEYKVGEKVRGIGVNSGNLYEGVVIGPSVVLNGEARIRITDILTRTASGQAAKTGGNANIKNVKRSSEVAYVNNLIGPKPEPVQEPKFVAPFQSDGRNVIDANGKILMRIVRGGYKPNQYASELPMAEAYEVARVVAEALNQKFAVTVGDSKSPF